jgi:hypothetical protein
MPEIYTPPSFEYQIDLTSRPTGKWLIETHMTFTQIGDFSKGMVDKALFATFAMQTRRFKSGMRTWVFLWLRGESGPGDYVATRKLTKLIVDHRCSIIWKEGKFGYEIDDFGKIIRKWELGSGYVIPVPALDSSDTSL